MVRIDLDADNTSWQDSAKKEMENINFSDLKRSAEKNQEQDKSAIFILLLVYT